MTIDVLRSFLLGCTLINFAVLLLWLFLLAFAREAIRSMHGRWFHLEDARFDEIHYTLMGVFKLGIFLFNLVPLIVLWIVG